MPRFRNAIAAIILLFAISILTFMPVVRSFYGLRVHHHLQPSLENPTSADQYLSHYTGNSTWTIIKYRLLSMPYVSKIKLCVPAIVLFISALLSFIAIVQKRIGYHHPLFKTKPVLSGPLYLQNCLLLI